MQPDSPIPKRHPMRVIENRPGVFKAVDIVREGFGQITVTERIGDDCTVSRDVPKCFAMSCDDFITQPNEAGGICPYCRTETERQQSGLPENMRLSEEEKDWISRPCHKHSHFCAAEFCGVQGCAKHMARSPDGQDVYFCHSHFQEVVAQLKMLAIEEQYGTAAAHTVKFWKSLFFDGHMKEFR